MKAALVYFLFITALAAKSVTYDLTVSQQSIEVAGKKAPALTINGGIPGPTLRFKQGDVAKIWVTNRLKNQETSLHWHGLLVPNQQDGVPYLTTPPIQPGQTHIFEFPLKHAGTYWYHSHTGLQEQQGVYGSIVVSPKEGENIKVDRDYVLALSDWSYENPKEIMRTLMRGSEYYSIKKGNAQSILGAYKAGALKDYFAREKSRMAPMDLSDVYYNAFLINGKRSSSLPARPGEKVRLRLINAGASTYFYAHSATGPLTIVAADGPAVMPTKVDKLLLGMAETYDVIITIPASGAYEFRATAQDNSGFASLFLGEGEKKLASSMPSPNLYSMDHMLEGAMNDMDSMGSMAKMSQGSMAMQSAHGAMQGRPGVPYAQLRSVKPSSIAASHPRREITLRLTGDMTRYIWSFNGKTLAEDSTIPVSKGEVLRIHLINDTMMHHPLHLHGHFFRLINGQGSHAPLKHTVDVAPMGKRTIEFLANEEGDWFFHCHLLYHMDAGMARVFSYKKAIDPSHQPSLDAAAIEPSFLFIHGDILTNMTMGSAMMMRGREDFGFMWEYSFDHKDYENDIFWGHYFNPNLNSMLGYRFTNGHHEKDRIFAQVNYRLPYLVESSLQLDSEGDVRLGLGKEFQLTPRVSAYGTLEYDTNTDFMWESGISYLLSKQWSLTGIYHTQHGFGVGCSFRF